MSESANIFPPAVVPSDEGRHESGTEHLWNESWYFDFANENVGGYLRFGLYPNRRQTWFQFAVTGPNRPLIVMVDEESEYAVGPTLRLATPRWTAELAELVPLESWHVVASATGTTFDDPLDVYADRPSDEVEIRADLTWQTVATPYHYGVSTRYEVSCRVTGSIQIGEEVIEIDCRGQRDHSWGVRDWWAFGWCWSAGAFDDGTHFHVSDIRFRDGATGFGYVTNEAGITLPATAISATESLDENGFPVTAGFVIEPFGLAITVEPVVFSPVVFRSDDGRRSHLPRALCLYRTEDGRVGHGWTEWNQLQEQE